MRDASDIFPIGDPRISYLARRCYVVISRVFPGRSQDTPQSKAGHTQFPQGLISPCALSSLGLRSHRPGFSASSQGTNHALGEDRGLVQPPPSHCAHSNRAISGWCLADALFIVCLLWPCQAASTRGIRRGTSQAVVQPPQDTLLRTDPLVLRATEHTLSILSSAQWSDFCLSLTLCASALATERVQLLSRQVSD